MKKNKRFNLWFGFLSGLACSASCMGGHTQNVAGDSNPVQGISQNGNSATPLPATSYVPKVKNLLTGLAATGDEVTQVANDPDQLRTLVTAWMATPEYQARMVEFFSTAFQQDSVQSDDIQNTSFNFSYVPGDPRLIANVRESFGRTAMELVNEGRPFTETMTTTRFMMTVPLMMLMAYEDDHYDYNNGFASEAVFTSDPNFHYTLTPKSVALTDSVNPSSANYLFFTAPQVQSATGNCAQPNGIYFDKTSGGLFGSSSMPSLMLSELYGAGFSAGGCYYRASSTGPVAAAEWNTWRMVNVRAPAKNENTTLFYDIATLRSATELVFNTPRVGFYTTIAFLSTWNTNASNQYRVTMNQTLIAGLGHAFDGTDTIAPQSLAALDTNHAAPGTACFACHQTLDPMRQYYGQAYDYYFSPVSGSVPGQFAFDGVSATGKGIADLGAHMAAHPRFGQAWTQKLCTWANAGPCNVTDPEFVRIQNAFVSSNFNFSTLVTELFTSPLITLTAPTVTNSGAGIFSVAKRQELCDLLSERLSLTDVCSLNPSTQTPAALANIKAIATMLPFDSYGRGATAPTQANDPGLFYRAALDNICTALASTVVDGGASSVYQSSDSKSAIASMVHTLMDVAAPRDVTPMAILTGHYKAALAAGLQPTDALKSTFVLACLSPTVAGIGQ